MKKSLLMSLLSCAILLPAAEQEILSSTPWKSHRGGGSVGAMTKQEDGTYLLEKTSKDGAFFFYNSGCEYPVTPGRIYRFVIEYKGDADANMMLQFPGAKRTPFPNVKAKNGVAEINIIAQEDETKARIHFVLNSAGKVTITRVAVEEISAGENFLATNALSWQKRDVAGAKSTIKKSGTGYEIDANAAKGYVAFVPGVYLPIAPGKHYLTTITAKRTADTVSFNSMYSMPGSKRTPFPTVASKAPVGEAETLRFVFTANADEKNLCPHLIIHGTGKVEISSLTLKELSDEEFAKEQGVK